MLHAFVHRLMKHISFNYKVITNFTLTEAELDHLLLIASHHYDGKCKAAGEVGGFIYGWKNMLLGRKERISATPEEIAEIEIDATIQQLDTITKILEIDWDDPNYRLKTAVNEEAKRAQNESVRINQVARAWMKGANPLSFLDSKNNEPCHVCKTVTSLSELAAIHNGTDHFGVCQNCIDKIPAGFNLCGCGG